MDEIERRTFRARLFEQFARIGKALASPRRLELVHLLAQAERSVEELARMVGQSIANTSQHLQVLREARLVLVRRKGNYVLYRIAEEQVLRVWVSLRDLAATRLTELDTIIGTLSNRPNIVEGITAEILKERLKKVLVLDVRPRIEYKFGHLASARSIPFTALRKQMKSLAERREIVVYGRGPYCTLAHQAVILLRTHGYKAVRLAEGFPEWKIKGFPVEIGDS